MAAAYRASAAGGANSNAAVAIALAPALGDLLIIGAVESGHDAIGAASVTDDRGGTYRLVKTQVLNVHLDGIASVWVRESLLTLSNDPTLANVTVTYTPDPSATGSEVIVVAVSGFATFDSAAIRQSVSATGAAAASVTASFAAAALTGNVTMSFVGCLTNPPGLTATASWTRRQNVGQATPIGLTVETRDSGFVGTAITWGTTAPSSFAIINIELDGNALGPVNQTIALPTVVCPAGLPGWSANRQQYLMPQRPRRESTMLAIAATQNIAKTITVIMRGVGSDLGVDGLAASLVVQLKKSGGAYATIAPVITARGGGAYDIALTNVHLNTLGVAALRVSLASALPGIEMVVTNDDTLIDVVVSAGTGDVNVVSMATNVLTASALASDAVTEIQAGLATTAALAVVAATVLSEFNTIAALHRRNSMLDGGSGFPAVQYTGSVLTAARLRVFASAAALAAAVAGHADNADSETHRYRLVGVPVGGKLGDMTIAAELEP